MKKRIVPSKNNRFILLCIAAYLSFMLVFISYHVFFAKKIIPGVYVGDFYVGGKDIESAVKFLSDNNKYEENVVSVVVDNAEPFIINPTDIELKVLYVKTVKEAFDVGRSGDFISDLISKFYFFSGHTKIGFAYDFSADLLQYQIDMITKSRINAVVEPSFQVGENGSLIIAAGVAGRVLEENLSDKILDGVSGNGAKLVNVSSHEVLPKFTVKDLEGLKPNVSGIIDVNYELVFDLYSRKLTKNEVLSLIRIEKDSGTVRLSFDDKNIVELLNSTALEIDRSPRIQVLTVQEGRALEFVAPENGQKLRIPESLEAIKTALTSKTPKINLSVEVTSPPEDENSFGVKEIVGVGHSKFKGSIPGRVANVSLAASRVNGVLVAPNEVFSFNEAVGEISAKTGYSTAYIISKGRTVLGDGGGVCQVSTTLFRAALNAGLPIIERNAHSYRVNYYEQDSAPGIDATIYSPFVDLKFKNDTPGYLLIISKFSAKDYTLSFTIYGTKDGRTVEMTEPVVLSRTPPPPVIYEPDQSLPSGVKKQVEQSVWGATVKFERKVISKEGDVLYLDTFKSNYRPWGAVYKIGV